MHQMLAQMHQMLAHMKTRSKINVQSVKKYYQAVIIIKNTQVHVRVKRIHCNARIVLKFLQNVQASVNT